MKEKHLPLYAVLEALDSKECPICLLATKSIESYFDSLLYENINDIGFRTKFRAQNGFCNYHSYKFIKYNDGLAVSLTHKDLLAQKIEQYKKNNYIIKAQKNNQNKCIICDVANNAELRYISEMINYLEDDELKSKFLKSEGLCIPHFELMIAKSKKIPKWFIEFNESKYKILLEQVNKFTESCNFSLGDRRPVLSIEEAESWKKAVKIIRGFEGMQSVL